MDDLARQDFYSLFAKMYQLSKNQILRVINLEIKMLEVVFEFDYWN